MRIFIVALVAVFMGSLLAAPAAASCRPPGSVAENAIRAEAVIYGVVTQTELGAVTMRIDRTLKGQVAGTLLVFVGSGRGGAAGSAVATSIDYPDMSGPPAVGSAHVLYLIRGSDGKFETDACIGSHPGGPNAGEVAYFGGGVTPTGTPSAPEPFMPPVNAGANPTPLLWLLMMLAVAAGVIAFVRRHRFA